MRTASAPPGPVFLTASAAGADWGLTAKACLDQLGPVAGCTLGFLYLTDGLAPHAASILTLLRGVTGIRDWVGTVGIGVVSRDAVFFDEPAMAVMVARLPEDAVRLFPMLTTDLDPLRRAAGGWLDKHGAAFALVHADPRNQQLPDLVARLSDSASAFLVGGTSASRGEFPQFCLPADVGLGGSVVADGGLSGALFAPSVAVATAKTQGCQPIGPKRTITASDDNVILEIDGRPALEVFKEDIGPDLANNLRRVAGVICAGLPIPGSDTQDYLVRDLVAIDPRAGWLSIAEPVATGQGILFTRRDAANAAADMRRTLATLKKRVTSPPKGAVYISCIARGPSLFNDADAELSMIREAFGDLPIVGFYASGEISHNRLYGYTGVLTLFL
ncbi:FIST signal transduction protein [Azospirillum griseum]|uniref:Histidine kinase n=1 Tax=Azospirillum griseum TaxID=2496639 RepID=A0A431VK31_9PROT|nr:FIST N-terminal domain-containing protein [Azospirillum griseum]RTR21970.1 histidine kinase [Azospirillum griseum]